MTRSTQPTLLLIGSDTPFAYLIGRYAERRGLSLLVRPTIPAAPMISALQPAAIIFLALENLEASQPPLAEMENENIPLLVCSGADDEARARELGADYCLQHPLTYDRFVTALQSTLPAKKPG